MAEEQSLLKQLDNWKSKYYQSISDLEKQRNYDELLQRSLGRLALAAQGLDPALDRQLGSLRKVLRKKNSAQHDIEHVLEKMERAIISMEKDKKDNKEQSSGEILVELLSSLKVARPYKAEARELAKQLKTSSNTEVASLIPQITSFFEHFLDQHAPAKPSSAFKFNLFGLTKPNEEIQAPSNADASIALDEDPGSEDHTQQEQNKIPAHLILMQLLEQLSLPANLTKRTTKIRHKIQTGLDDDQLPTIIDEIAEIIGSLGSQIVAEKLEYEAFLKSLTLKLNQLNDYILANTDDEIKAFEERRSIGLSVEGTVQNIKNSVGDADNLQQLKQSVSSTLDTLNQHFSSYQQSDIQQFEQSQSQIRELKQRIQIMEQESIELRQTAMKSRDQALKDPLTGLWNRQALNEILEKEFTRWQRYQKPLSIILWDIDLFKNINDIYGHAAGDKVLKTLAQLLVSQTREADFIARYGGEEFIGVFPETELFDALKLADKIRQKVMSSKFHHGETAVTVTTSAGLTCFKEGDTIDDAFMRADKALYKAKENGRNCCILADG